MNVTATIEKPSTGKTLADLDDGVAARVRMVGSTSGQEFIRWRHGNDVLGPTNDFSGPISTCQCDKPAKYEVIEVLGKFTVKFTPD